MIKVSDYIAQFVANLGVKHVFTVSGGGAMFLVDSFHKHKDIDLVHMLHEQSAGIAADAYAQYSQSIGVCLVTSGPGSTNAITACTASYIDSTPLLYISGQCKTSDMSNGTVRQKGVQEVDIISMVKGITKYAVTIKNPLEIEKILSEAVYKSMSERKAPVWIDVPLDVQSAMIDEKDLIEFEYPSEKITFPYIPEIIKLINESERPVILVGNGIRLANAQEEFRELVDGLGCAVLTTWRGADLIEDEHPLYFGRPGTIGSKYANMIQQEADLIICIGARLDLLQVGFNYEHFGYKAKIIYIDIDKSELTKGNDADLYINCDAGCFIKSLLQEYKKDSFWSNTSHLHDTWMIQCQELKQEYPLVSTQKSSYINAYDFIETLSDLATSEDIIIPSSAGQAAEITLQAWKIKRGQRMFSLPGLGSMGFAIPMAIGAALASGKRVICIEGDGSLQHNIQELETVRRLNLPIKIFILNNNGYASIRNTHEKFFGNNPVSDLTTPELEKISKAYLLNYLCNTDLEKTEKRIAYSLSDSQPQITEIFINPDQETICKLKSKMIDGKMVTENMEDLE